jgi:hypothetical protein
MRMARRRPTPDMRWVRKDQEEYALANPRPLETWITVVYVCPKHGSHRSHHTVPVRNTCQREYSDMSGVSLPLCGLAVMSATVEKEWLR